MSKKKLIQFTVNGKKIETGEIDKPLIKVLRDTLGLTGTKEGCGKGYCGSCAVLVDNKPTLSCVTPVNKVKGREILTIEGIGTPEHPHPLQKAFVAAGAVQCGFCTPGMIVAAKALLDKNPNPTRKQIVKKMSGHLCRCTGYVKIIDAIQIGSKMLRGETIDFDTGPLPIIGSNLDRIDSLEKACGVAKYTADLYMEGMLYAKALRCPYSHARILSIDIKEALNSPGVVDVITASEIPGENISGEYIPDWPVLASEKIRFMGEPVAAVAAVTEEAATEALKRIKVEYVPLEPMLSPEQSLEENAPKIHDKGNILMVSKIKKGDVERGFKDSDIVVENSYRTQRVEHAYLEPEAGLSYIDGSGRVVLIVPSIEPHRMQRQIARMLGISDENVRVSSATIGGGFGAKHDFTVHGILALFAYRLKKPVKFVFSREESFLVSDKKHPLTIKCKTGVKKSGYLTAQRAEIIGDTGAYASASPGVCLRAANHVSGPYEIPNVWVESKFVYTNNVVSGAMRGFGAQQVHFAAEVQMDIIAKELGIDPLELRLLNCFSIGSVTATGQTLSSSVGIKSTIEAIRPHYIAARKGVVAFNAKNSRLKRRGIGIACMFYGIGSTGRKVTTNASVELAKDGSICLRSGTGDKGQGCNTVLAQIAAEKLGVPYNKIRVISADSYLTPDCGTSTASRTTYFGGNAVVIAAGRLREKLMEIGSVMLDTDEDLEITQGKMHMKSKESKRVGLEEIAEFFYRKNPQEVLVCHGSYDGPLVTMQDLETGQGSPYETYAFATHLAEVEVDIPTGKVDVIRFIAAHDTGRTINPRCAEGQIEGSILMGLGITLKEKFEQGKTTNFDTYRIPRMADCPEIRVILLEDPVPTGPFGAKGVGECAFVCTAPAIVNAITDAIGGRFFELPVTEKEILKALELSRRSKSEIQ